MRSEKVALLKITGAILLAYSAFVLNASDGKNASDNLFYLDFKKNSATASFSAGTPECKGGKPVFIKDNAVYCLKAQGKDFEKLQYSAVGNINPAEGTLEIKYKPSFSKDIQGQLKIYRIFLLADKPESDSFAIGVNTAADGKRYLWALMRNGHTGGKDYGIYQSVNMEKDVWCEISVSWDKDSLKLFLDKKLLASVPMKGNLPDVSSFYLGGSFYLENAEGLIEYFKISPKPSEAKAANISITFRGDSGNASISKVQEEQSKIDFILEAPLVNINFLVKAVKFPIKKSNLYWINSTYHDPFVVRAEDDGILNFKLEKTNYCSVRIEPCLSENLLANPSFENVGKSLIEGWKTSINQGKNISSLDYGHENMPEHKDDLKKATNEVAAENKIVHSGSKSLRLSRSGEGAIVQCTTAEPLSLEAGKEYLLSGYYHSEDLKYGTILHFRTLLNGTGKQEKIFSDITINPPINTRKDEWRYVYIRFKVPEDYQDSKPVVTVRLELAGTPSVVYWDDIDLRVAPSKVMQVPKQLTDLQKKPKYTPAEVKSFMKDRKPYDVKVARIADQPRLIVNGKPVGLFGFNAGPSWWPSSGAHKDFGEAGVHLHWIPINLGLPKSGFGPQVWLDDGKYDFSSVEERLAEIIGLDPDAMVLFYLFCYPYPEFVDKHPEAAWINLRGKKTVGEKSHYKEVEKRTDKETWNYSYTSKAFRDETSRALAALGENLAKSDLGKAVIGVHMLSGADGQWFAPHWPDHFDRSEGNLTAFRDWLRKEYNGDDKLLQNSWGDNAVLFEKVTIPEEAERSPDNYYLDPSNGHDRRIIDMNRFHNIGVTETINILAAAFKQGIKRPAIVTTYYNDIIHNHGSNKWALKTLLESDSLDGIVSVTDYGLLRFPGRTGGYNSCQASLRLHNKLFISEIDYRSDYSWFVSGDDRRFLGAPKGDEGIASQLRRDLGYSLAQGEGAWYYSLGGNGFDNKKMFSYAAEAMKAAKLSATEPVVGDWGQLGVFIDERMEDYATAKNIYNASVAMVSGNTTRQALSRSGLAWDPYLLSDIDNPKRPNYKINIFLSATTITPEQVDWIKKNLQKNGNILVFIHTAGIAYGGIEKNVKTLTGINTKYEPNKKVVYRYSKKDLKDPLSKSLKYLFSETAGPLVYIDDPDATTLGILESVEDKTVAAVKRHKDWTGIYIALPGGITPGFLRALANEAKIIPHGPEGDVTFAGNGFIGIHALSSGNKTLNWSETSDLLDLTSGDVAAKNTVSFSFNMQVGETRWFRVLNKK